MQPLDESKQKKALQAIENFDRDAFTKAMLGKAAPGPLDYLFPTGKFSQTWETFDALVGKRLSAAQEEEQARKSVPQMQAEMAAQFPSVFTSGLIQPQMRQGQVEVQGPPTLQSMLALPNIQEEIQRMQSVLPTPGMIPMSNISEPFAQEAALASLRPGDVPKVTRPIQEFDPTAPISPYAQQLSQKFLEEEAVQRARRTPITVQTEAERNEILSAYAERDALAAQEPPAEPPARQAWQERKEEVQARIDAFLGKETPVRKRVEARIGAGAKPEKITNLVDQSIGIESKGRYRTLQEALNAGDIETAQRGFDRAKLEIPVAVSAATGQEAQRIQQQAPLPQAERKNLVTRKAFIESGDLQHLPPGTTKGAAARADVIEISDKQLENIAALQGSIESVRGMFDMADELITATGAGEAKLKQLPALTAGALLGTNPSAATYKAVRDAFTTTTARQVGQERGVLTDQDVARWARTLPDFGDTVAIKEKKRKVFNRILKATMEANRRIIAGDSATDVIKDARLKLGPLMKETEAFDPTLEEVIKKAKPK